MKWFRQSWIRFCSFELTVQTCWYCFTQSFKCLWGKFKQREAYFSLGPIYALPFLVVLDGLLSFHLNHLKTCYQGSCSAQCREPNTSTRMGLSLRAFFLHCLWDVKQQTKRTSDTGWLIHSNHYVAGTIAWNFQGLRHPPVSFLIFIPSCSAYVLITQLRDPIKKWGQDI